MMTSTTAVLLAGLFVVVSAGCSSASRGDAGIPAPDPQEVPAAATGFRLSAEDLRTRLFAYADDSMMGRKAGEAGNVKATAYIAAELARIGLEPAGDSGTYFQEVPFGTYSPDLSRKPMANGIELQWGEDLVQLPPLQNIPVSLDAAVDGVPVVYGGRVGVPTSYLDAADGLDKVVVLDAARDETGSPVFSFDPNALSRFFQSATAIVFANLDYATEGFVNFLMSPHAFLETPPARARVAVAFISRGAAESLFGGPLGDLEPGASGTPFEGDFGFAVDDGVSPTRNVIGILLGSDPRLRSEYVAIGAHSDHLGTASEPVDHDSLRVYLGMVRPEGAEQPAREPTAEEAELIQSRLAEVRARRPTPRMDSIFNGADDDGSGSVTVLEIAEALAALPVRPKRSILFVWHNAEEAGLLGSDYFTRHPSVPLEKVVAQLNIDMIGRGNEDDVENGGPGHLELIGSRRRSSELGDLVERINRERNFGFEFDYQFDAPGHPMNIYCRSDHWQYARFGIPVVFFTTGGHRDYHMLTDEPQYINYEKLARVGGLVMTIAEEIANLDHRLATDQPKPADPFGACRQ